ncbi:MAG: putative capsid protein [Cressdnaviricota sp.]|nr:MAG: putative capsid protein [Cressdnaviricota sp.]
MGRRYKAKYSSRSVARRAKKNKGAYAQSKQIASLSRQVSRVAEISSVPLQLRWQRSNNLINRTPLTAGNGGNLEPYICPIPVAPNQLGAGDIHDFGDNGPNQDQAIPATDFRKSKIWITATDVNQKPRCTHRGGYLTYKLQRANVSLRYVKVMLIRAKPSIADQLSLQRGFQFYDPTNNVIAGQNSTLLKDYDYIHNPVTTVNDPVTGIQMNPQIWDVLGSHSYKFGTDKLYIADNGALPNNTVANPMRTDATGFFKLPAGGAVHKIWSADHTQQATNLDYRNQRSEKNVFLVIFAQRGSIITDPDTQPLPDVPEWEMKLAMQVRDTYSCSEGSLTPQTRGGGRGRGRPRGALGYGRGRGRGRGR